MVSVTASHGLGKRREASPQKPHAKFLLSILSCKLHALCWRVHLPGPGTFHGLLSKLRPWPMCATGMRALVRPLHACMHAERRSMLLQFNTT